MRLSEVREETYKIVIGRVNEYARAKRIFNIAKHPTFIGKDMVYRSANNGGLFFFQKDNIDLSVAIMNTRKNVLTAMCVIPSARGIGLGGFMVDFLKPNWIRALQSAVPFFKKKGYIEVGMLKMGRKLKTQIMVRKNIMDLAGKISELYEK